MIYLVLNVEDQPVVLDICSSLEVANSLAKIYTTNFESNKRCKCDFIMVEPVDTDTGSDILWTLYPEDREDKLTYNYQTTY